MFQLLARTAAIHAKMPCNTSWDPSMRGVKSRPSPVRCLDEVLGEAGKQSVHTVRVDLVWVGILPGNGARGIIQTCESGYETWWKSFAYMASLDALSHRFFDFSARSEVDQPSARTKETCSLYAM
ncbi:hypothetical protein HBI56_068610 [Parastagonospora nodorum]|nr:hypothetical protein HBH53_128950 [Parastagonospora nodorum]KAH4179278.1 hypothetical protein HBH43_015220 [Parastagonospora nodorum]KAH4810355.1 hypothetical protein HBH61_100540 [Parastagonospora nodorum]KAH4936646.1 hypothetical protein HBI79_069370 [Parastagonospora nodorum]KAH5503441.1 hypothetical protein HBI31_065930 [Parastagonospora nodorum]